MTEQLTVEAGEMIPQRWMLISLDGKILRVTRVEGMRIWTRPLNRFERAYRWVRGMK